MGLIIQGKTGLFLHLFVLLFFIFALHASMGVGKYLRTTEHLNEQLKHLGQFRLHFFTIWNFVLQIVFLITAVLDELFKLYNLNINIQKRLGRTRAFLFNTFVFPCSLLVITIFWSLWHIDRDLIFPEIIDQFYPVWLNHTLHTLIVLPLIIELLLPKKYSFVKFQNAVVILMGYLTFYQILYLSVYLRYGIWLYPVHKVLGWTGRILLTLLQLVLGLAYLKIGIDVQNSKRPALLKTK